MYRSFEAEGEAVANGQAQSPSEAADPRPSRRQRIAARLRPLLREPLTHFVILGVLIFAVAHWLEARSQRYVITIAPADVTRIENSYVQQYGNMPTLAQLRTMIDNSVREEIYLREALALGLDRNDEIVRRRLAQKYQFLQADMATPRTPSDAELRRWFEAHAASFAEPARRSFDQRYFAIDQRGEGAARTLATATVAKLGHGEAASAGDEFPGPKIVARMAQDDVERLFGDGAFARAIFAARPGQWVGPFRSGFGWHAVRVTDSAPARSRSFSEARADALMAWQEQDRLTRNDAAYRQLLARYTVKRGDRP
ncbi:peptidyl-prolyl cis-trans isomerase [Sphingobium sp. EM0848]|uniref:peptidyl-prolyl cis-trans isomerase n=1 Tax=Sphingobium sp. EM0848 TaxID=2743473 RepID=UPI00159C3A02|nr:peptidyl-prolyl cis-trans isomerase [Sphingobium sp. EM0848]